MDGNKYTADVLLDQPRYSRLFVAYNKTCLSEDVMRTEFSKFGFIEDIKVPYDDQGVSKGICFIKFAKTSDAARALEGMHKKTLPGSNRIVKVSVAVNPSEVDSNPHDDEKYRRIFIQVSKKVKEKDLEEEFATYGHIMSVFIPKDRQTGKSSPWAFITFAKFSEAANAVEQCPRHYRAVFAKPKNSKPDTSLNDDFLPQPVHNNREYSITSMLGNRLEGFVKVNFICPFQLSQHQVKRFFDIVPGMTDFHVFPDYAQNCVKGVVTYSNPNSAAYAVERLHDFPFGPGLSILVKGDHFSSMQNRNSARNHQIKNSMPQVVTNLKNALLASTSTGAPDLAQLSEAVIEANKLLKLALNVPTDDSGIDESNVNYCSVKLPPIQPLADIDSRLAKRCFIICKPAPPPIVALRDIFCRFGDLITVYALPNKTVGYAQYASVKAADEAMKTLHGAVICGVRIKVLEADDEAPPKKRRNDSY